MKNLFQKSTHDKVMQIIDTNIYEEGGLVFQEPKDIEQKVLNFLEMKKNDVNLIFRLLYNQTLLEIIEEKQKYELYRNLIETEKPLEDIWQLKYDSVGAFSQAMKRYCHHSATEVREKKIYKKKEEYEFPFVLINDNHPLDRALKEYHDKESEEALEYIEEYIRCSNEYPFSNEVISLSADLAYKLDIGLSTFLEDIFSSYCDEMMLKQ